MLAFKYTCKIYRARELNETEFVSKPVRTKVRGCVIVLLETIEKERPSEREKKRHRSCLAEDSRISRKIY